MAAFTSFKREALDRYLIMYELGELSHFEPIAEGIENSNYFVTLKNGETLDEYVLTITESLSFEEVPFFNTLMAKLFRHGLPVPDPQRTLDGMSSTIFCGKPTWLFTKLPGKHPTQVTSDHCFSIGSKLAELHEAAQGLQYTRSNPYSSEWVNQTLSSIDSKFEASDLLLLIEIAGQYAEFDQATELPRGIIHGDLFKDNTLFLNDELTGIIDFYHACDDVLIQDLAIAINDWCMTQQGTIDEGLRDSLLKGYESMRKLTEFEMDALPMFQRFAALRFLLTRFISGEDDTPLKDPHEFLRLIKNLSV